MEVSTAGISSKAQCLYFLDSASLHLTAGRKHISAAWFGWVPEKLMICRHHNLHSHRGLLCLHNKC